MTCPLCAREAAIDALYAEWRGGEVGPNQFLDRLVELLSGAGNSAK